MLGSLSDMRGSSRSPSHGSHILKKLKSKIKIMKKTTKQKILIWLTIIITAVNFLLVIAFVVFLYFWVKGK